MPEKISTNRYENNENYDDLLSHEEFNVTKCLLNSIVVVQECDATTDQ
jgi:hypothetical protein